jgi:hypothetical protein
VLERFPTLRMQFFKLFGVHFPPFGDFFESEMRPVRYLSLDYTKRQTKQLVLL